MQLPAPYIPTMQPPPAVAPVTAADVLSVQYQQQQLQDAERRNRLAGMIEQEAMSDQRAKKLWASHAILQGAPPATNRLSVQQPTPQPAPTATPAPAAANPLGPAADPQASMQPTDLLHQSFIADRDNPHTPDPVPDTDDPYAIRVPDRAPRTWLMQQAREGKIDPQAALRYDAETQEMVKAKTAEYEAQGKQYGAIVAPEVESYMEKGDMKGLRSVMEKMRQELPNNPIARQKADHTIAFIDKGGVIGQGGTTTYPVVVTEENQKLVAQKYLEAGGDPRMTPVPGETWKFTDQKGQTLKVVQDVAGGGKEPLSSQGAWLKGRIAELRASGMSQPKAETQAAKEYEDRLDKRKENQTRVTVQVRTDAKEKSEKAKEARKQSPEEDMAPLVAEYLVTHKQPNNMRDATTQKQFRHEVARTLKGIGLTPTDWAKMGPSSKAAQSALTKIKDVNSKTTQLEDTAKQLLDRALEQRAKLPRGVGAKKIDEWLNHAKGNWKGDPKLRTIEGTIYEALVDYGRVMSGSVSQSGITDSARHEAARLLASADNPTAFKSIVDNMKATMAMRLKANQAIEEGLLSAANGPLGGSAAPAALPGGVTMTDLDAELARRKKR